MNTELVDFPERLFTNGRPPNMNAKELAQAVLDAPIGKSVKVDLEGKASAKAIAVSVKYHVNKAGWKLQMRTNGLGSLFLMRGSKLELANREGGKA